MRIISENKMIDINYSNVTLRIVPVDIYFTLNADTLYSDNWVPLLETRGKKLTEKDCLEILNYIHAQYKGGMKICYLDVIFRFK